MKSIIGVYETREKATAAIEELKKNGFNDGLVTLVNKEELLHNHIHVNTTATVEIVELLIGAIIGAGVGAAIGTGVINIPGLSFLYNEGLAHGAGSGAMIGSFISGVIAIATAFFTDRYYASKYDKELNQGKYLVMVDGNKRELEVAHKVVHTANLDLELE